MRSPCAGTVSSILAGYQWQTGHRGRSNRILTGHDRSVSPATSIVAVHTVSLPFQCWLMQSHVCCCRCGGGCGASDQGAATALLWPSGSAGTFQLPAEQGDSNQLIETLCLLPLPCLALPTPCQFPGFLCLCVVHLMSKVGSRFVLRRDVISGDLDEGYRTCQRLPAVHLQGSV